MNKIILGDCIEVMKDYPDNYFDLVLTDPPYGINKAEWDSEFVIHWLEEACRLAPRVGVMCGTWNLLKMPEIIGNHKYKWTMAAHLTNGMTRGALGFGNWIPCVVYQTTHVKIDEPTVKWCSEFTDWCVQNGITKTDLNNATGFSDMGGWWMSKLPHRCVAPNEINYAVLKKAFLIPDRFDTLPPPSDYSPIGDCRDFTIGSDKKPNHPSPKPLNVTKWFVESLSKPDDLILDPFLGSGTTMLAAQDLGRDCIGIEINSEYIPVAEARLRQGVLL